MGRCLTCRAKIAFRFGKIFHDIDGKLSIKNAECQAPNVPPMWFCRRTKTQRKKNYHAILKAGYSPFVAHRCRDWRPSKIKIMLEKFNENLESRIKQKDRGELNEDPHGRIEQCDQLGVLLCDQ